MASVRNSESKESMIPTSTVTAIKTKTENTKYLSSTRGRANGPLRRESNGFDTVIHHKRSLLGFCLRLGAVGFGAGSLVFTGLQIGAEIASGPFSAIIPATRLLLITAQMHFIFLNSKNLELPRHGALAKLGLMHMIATNLGEWLQALVDETQNEIDQLGHAYEGDEGILKSLLRDASPFLFPCTIEFSLICAVILFEMWKRVDVKGESKRIENSTKPVHRLGIDCTSAHR